MAVDGPDELSRTSLRNAISNAMARIKREYYGKGPARTRTLVYGRIVISVLDDAGQPRVRRAGGDADRPPGARVPQPDRLRPDMVFEIFVLEDAA
jgi:hypothetical protein